MPKTFETNKLQAGAELNYFAMAAILNLPTHVKKKIVSDYFGDSFTIYEEDVGDSYKELMKLSKII